MIISAYVLWDERVFLSDEERRDDREDDYVILRFFDLNENVEQITSHSVYEEDTTEMKRIQSLQNLKIESELKVEENEKDAKVDRAEDLTNVFSTACSTDQIDSN